MINVLELVGTLQLSHHVGHFISPGWGLAKNLPNLNKEFLFLDISRFSQTHLNNINSSKQGN